MPPTYAPYPSEVREPSTIVASLNSGCASAAASNFFPVSAISSLPFSGTPMAAAIIVVCCSHEILYWSPSLGTPTVGAIFFRVS